MGEVMPFPEMPKQEGPMEEKEGKILEFKRKLEEEAPEKGVELKEKVNIEISGEELHAVLVGLLHERRGLKAQLEEVKGDPEMEAALGGMIEGMLQRNADLMSRLSAQDPKLEEHFKKAIE